ncbi:MAG: hypothetical protein RRY38_04405, partial [Oscillospiraceae bacterium]
MTELEFLNINGAYGGDQHWFRRPMMRLGGCSTVCGCHVAALLAMDDRERAALWPYDSLNITKKQFCAFAHEMYKYIYPGSRGMTELSLFENGFSRYARSVGQRAEYEPLEGAAPYQRAEDLVRSAINGGVSAQYLLLEHESDHIDDIEWHWFTVTGYDERPDGFYIIY